MVSLKDISIACGVSVATVSKALNNHKDIGEKTKERIRKTAREMGYFPNSAAKALKTNRTKNIGVLFVDEGRSGLTHDYFSHVLDSFKRTTEEKGYDITFINCSRSSEGRMSYLEHAKYRSFDGVVIACIDFESPEVVELVHSGIPVVTIDYVFNNRMAVVSDNVNGMKDLVQHIYDRGHRKIAYIHGEDTAVTQSRLSSFYHTIEKLGITIPDSYVRKAGYRNIEKCYEVTKELLDLPEPPTCILFPDDYAAFGGINVVKERNMRIPEDISIAGYDGMKIGKFLFPQLATLEQDTYTIGKKAAESLINMIENPRATVVKQILVSGKVFEGESILDLNKTQDK